MPLRRVARVKGKAEDTKRAMIFRYHYFFIAFSLREFNLKSISQATSSYRGHRGVINSKHVRLQGEGVHDDDDGHACNYKRNPSDSKEVLSSLASGLSLAS